MKIFILHKYICLNPAILYILVIKNQSTFVKLSEIMINNLLTRKPHASPYCSVFIKFLSLILELNEFFMRYIL